MLTACEPRGGRHKSSPETKRKSLQGEVEQLKRECARQQALLRAARRTVGLPSDTKLKGGGKGKRRRKTRPRAMRVVAMLRQPREEEPHANPAAGTA